MESIRQIRERNLVELAKGVSINDALLLQRISHRLHQLDEHACNWGLSERQEKRNDRLEEPAGNIAQNYNLVAYHQSDPRGWSLYLVKPELQPIDQHYPEGLAICPH